MVEIKIEIPDELGFVEQIPSIEWSMLAGKLIKSKLDKIVKLKRIIAKSRLTERDVEELSNDINMSLSKRYLK